MRNEGETEDGFDDNVVLGILMLGNLGTEQYFAKDDFAFIVKMDPQSVPSAYQVSSISTPSLFNTFNLYLITENESHNVTMTFECSCK